METVRLVHASHGDIGPHHAVASKDNTWIHDAVASCGDPFTQHGAKLTKPARDSLVAVAEMHFPAIVAEVAEFGTGAEIGTFAENGITDVVEMRSFGPGEQDGVFGFGRMTDHGIGTNPRIFANVCTASNRRSGPDVAGADQVGTSLHGGRGVNDDSFTSHEETRVAAGDVALQVGHLGFQTRFVGRVEDGPDRSFGWQIGKRPVFGARKRGEQHGCIGEFTPVHASSQTALGHECDDASSGEMVDSLTGG